MEDGKRRGKGGRTHRHTPDGRVYDAAMVDFCIYCGEYCETVVRQAPGWHLECMVRASFGGAYHIQKQCSCYGGPNDAGDERRHSKREAAQAAVLAVCWEEWDRGSEHKQGDPRDPDSPYPMFGCDTLMPKPRAKPT